MIPSLLMNQTQNTSPLSVLLFGAILLSSNYLKLLSVTNALALSSFSVSSQTLFLTSFFFFHFHSVFHFHLIWSWQSKQFQLWSTMAGSPLGDTASPCKLWHGERRGGKKWCSLKHLSSQGRCPDECDSSVNQSSRFPTWKPPSETRFF